MTTIKTDSNGKPPEFYPGDRVFVGPVQMPATVIRQVLHYDMNESFWGNLELMYDDGQKGTSHCWQVKRIDVYHFDVYEDKIHKDIPNFRPAKSVRVKK